MSQPGATWGDLPQRVMTAAGLVVVGGAAIWVGGWTFAVATAAICAAMVWELSRMVAPDRPGEARIVAASAFAALILARLAPEFLVPVLLVLPGMVGLRLLQRHPTSFFGFTFGILLAGYGLAEFRDLHGVVWLFWLVLVVVATDIAGYFGGKAIGGPKFWPRISPKKTWAGVVSGWIAAAIVGAAFLIFTDAGRDLIWISVLLSFASQMGDIAQSAVKRREGVKDSSDLLPGHGGLWDRFDGLLAAALLMLLVAQVVDVPEVRF